MIFQWSIFVFGVLCVGEISGHGMMLEPPNRSSLWRFPREFPGATPNYNDNENFCGGMSVQWNTFGGRCGVCGDRYDRPHPQNNENTGLYGKMGIARTYKSGQIIDVQIHLTKNHMGYFKYSICVLDNPKAPESGEECFKAVTLNDGSPHYNVSYTENLINHKVKLPDGLTCERCVFRWHYNAGNNWGKCDDGSYKEGCGPQETFRSCADIRIEA